MNYAKAGIVVLMIMAVPCIVFAESSPIPVEIEGQTTKVSLLDGSANVLTTQAEQPAQLAVGDLVGHGDQVITGKNSRLELLLPDQSMVRFDEETRFEIVSLDFDASQGKRDVNLKMALGKTWANVAKSAGAQNRFAFSTKTAIAGVRGTIYRLNVNSDESVVVKVYWGEVGVSSIPSGVSPVSKPSAVMQPSTVEGPHPIEGPKPVSMEQWTYIVRSMQQIVVRPDGTATPPFSFSAEEDMDDWVRWNQMRDQAMQH